MLRRITLILILGLLASGVFIGCKSFGTHELTLVKDGKPEAVIVLADKPDKAAQLSAYELQAHIKLITGAELPIIKEGDKSQGIKIYIGDCKFVRELDITNEKLGKQEYEIRFLSDAIILKGKDKEDYGKVNYRFIPKHSQKKQLAYDYQSWPDWWDEKATLYATYDFLKKFCGVRWFDCTDYGTDYPETKTLTIKGKDIKRAPAFSFRSVYTYINLEDYDAVCGLWHPKSKGYEKYEKAAFAELRKKFPQQYIFDWYGKRGQIRAYLYRNLVGGEKFGANHSFYAYYDRFWKKNPKNAEVFKGEHPKWFAQDNNDTQGRPAQLCYSNEEALKQVIDDANGWFEGRALNPGNGKPIKDDQRNKYWGNNFFAVVPMDNGRWCKCPKCQVQLKPRHEPYTFSNGSASDYIWGFVNKVAKALKTTHPDKEVAALAYASYAHYPDNVKLEDNIAVQLCLGIRNVYSRSDQKNDWGILEKWRGLEKNRSLYLWLYYCFPTERCNRTKNPDTWHCFPGFFAHYIGKAFKKYKESGVKGAFFNGFGQDVEAYISFAMLDDPNQNVDKLLDEYFSRMYGPAGEPLKKLYNRIEDIYSNPDNYPMERPGHQYEILAWSFLGTKERMEELGALMADAEKAIKGGSDIQKKRFELFKLAVWDYMVQGKEKFQKKMQGYNPVKSLNCPLMIGKQANGDLAKVNWEDGQELPNWLSKYAEGTVREILGNMLHDERFLYLELKELNLKKAPDGKDDYWQVMIADAKDRNLREILITPDGQVKAFAIDEKGKKLPLEDFKASVDSEYKDGVWTLKAALPLLKLQPLGILPGDTCRLNIIRRSRVSKDQPMLCSTFGDFDNVKRFARIKFDERKNTIPEPQKASDEDLVGRWSFEGTGEEVKDSSGKGNHGKLEGKPERIDGPFGKALELKLDNGCQYVEIEKPKGLGDLKKFTIAAWFNIDPRWSYHQPTYYTIISGWGGLHIDFRPIGRPWFSAPGKDKKHFYHQTFSRTLSSENWDFVAITYDGEIMTIYVNGRVADRTKKGEIVWDDKKDFLRIGANSNKAWHFQFRGKIDEVEMYKNALSGAEIMYKYQDGLKKINNWKNKN
jgi:hypothetical protein